MRLKKVKNATIIVADNNQHSSTTDYLHTLSVNPSINKQKTEKMKKTILFAAFAALTMVFTTSCENDDDFSCNGSNNLTYGKSAELSLNVDVDGYNATRAASIITGWSSLSNPSKE